MGLAGEKTTKENKHTLADNYLLFPKNIHSFEFFHKYTAILITTIYFMMTHIGWWVFMKPFYLFIIHI